MRASVKLAAVASLVGCNGGSALLLQPPDVRDVPPVLTAAAAPLSPDPPSTGPSRPPAPLDCAEGSVGHEYLVGPGKKYESIGDVPLEHLGAGDTVRIAWRPEPYREKLMISGTGTPQAPIRICGVPGPHGELPVIDGENATTRRELDFPYDGHQPRGLVIIGHQHADQDYERTPSYIVLQGMKIRNGSPPFTFTDKAGKVTPYSAIASGLFVERAAHLVVRGCEIEQNNNGVFIGTGGGVALTHDVLLEGNSIHDNGSLTRYYEHNVYNEASNVTYQYNRFGSPRAGKSGVQGANIKERSAGVVIRYNWIEDGAHILDIVDAQEARESTLAMPTFHTTYVYGNVIVRGAAPSGSLIHYGGDSGVLETYRKGTLYFYDNTVIVHNDAYPDWTGTAIFELATNDEHLDARNNVFFSTKRPVEKKPIGMLGVRDGVISGVAAFSHNWVGEGWTASPVTPGGTPDIKSEVRGLADSTRGVDPGFRNLGAGDPALAAAPAKWAPAALEPDIPASFLPTRQYAAGTLGKPRSAAPIVPGAVSD